MLSVGGNSHCALKHDQRLAEARPERVFQWENSHCALKHELAFRVLRGDVLSVGGDSHCALKHGLRRQGAPPPRRFQWEDSHCALKLPSMTPKAASRTHAFSGGRLPLCIEPIPFRDFRGSLSVGSNSHCALKPLLSDMQPSRPPIFQWETPTCALKPLDDPKPREVAPPLSGRRLPLCIERRT